MSNKKRNKENNDCDNQQKAVANFYEKSYMLSGSKLNSDGTLSIKLPAYYKFDKEKSNNETLVFTKTKPEFPKIWEEFCNNYPIKNEYYIDSCGNARRCTSTRARSQRLDINVLPNKRLANAIVALMQLIQLRDCYNDGWEPDWTNCNEDKPCIIRRGNSIGIVDMHYDARVMCFKTDDICDKFFENFKDLLTIAAPLL